MIQNVQCSPDYLITQARPQNWRVLSDEQQHKRALPQIETTIMDGVL